MLESDTTSGTDRGQAYTLEGFIGAMVVLMAVLLALQSVVIMPTTSGTADRGVQNQLQQETKDALVVAAQDGDLSETIRNWDEDANDGEGGFHNASQPGPDGERTYDVGSFANQSTLGEILESRFADKGRSYNVELVANDGGEFNATRLVYQGSAPPDAFTASYTVTLYEDDILTAPSDNPSTLENSSTYPVSNEGDDPLYNVVEVRVVVW
ncbi:MULTISPECIES: DUF7288 family protein [Natrialbaceae]|uniref:DUF7288 family protein n=1 Tax=Natrialbaceae TaxID=1644061 RepID=UPI00207C2448|nr:hypothetical protein [Natronococcus sp. CG52]